jgi:hypothetical protein
MSSKISSAILLIAIPTWARAIETILCTGVITSPVHKRQAVLQLQQLDRSDFQRIALHISTDVHAKVVFLVRRFESFHNL